MSGISSPYYTDYSSGQRPVMNYMAEHRNQFAIGAAVAVFVLLVVMLIYFFYKPRNSKFTDAQGNPLNRPATGGAYDRRVSGNALMAERSDPGATYEPHEPPFAQESVDHSESQAFQTINDRRPVAKFTGKSQMEFFGDFDRVDAIDKLTTDIPEVTGPVLSEDDLLNHMGL